MKILFKQILITLFVLFAINFGMPIWHDPAVAINAQRPSFVNVLIPMVHAQDFLTANTTSKQVCETVYDTITSASGHRSRRPRKVCETVSVPAPEPVVTPKPEVATPTPTPVPKVQTPSVLPSPSSPIFSKVISESTPISQINLDQQNLLNQEVRSILLRALWDIRNLLLQSFDN